MTHNPTDRQVLPLDEIIDPSRRRFCQGAALGLVVLGTSGLGCDTAPDVRSDGGADLGGPRDLTAAAPEDLAGGMCPSSAKDTGSAPASFALNTATFIAADRLFICRDGGGLFALSSICTHQGCDVAFSNGAFDCPCHFSRFNYTGAVTKGPANTPLPHRHLCLTGTGTLGYAPTLTVAANVRYSF